MQVIAALFAIGFLIVAAMTIRGLMPDKKKKPPLLMSHFRNREPELVDSEGMVIPGKMWKGFSLN